MTVTEKIESDVQAKIEQLKKRMVKEMKPSFYENSHTFYRFLKARDFDLDQAEVMLRKHLEWRKEFDVDNLQSFKPAPPTAPDIEDYFPVTIIGFDKEGSPIKYCDYGNMDPKGIQKAVKFLDRVKCLIKIMEEEMMVLEKQSLKIGKNLKGTIYIIDMKNFSFINATDKKTIEDLIYFAKLYQENYPERLQKVYFINVSSYFAITYSMLKSFVAASILQKMQMWSSPEEWKPELLKVIDSEVLPTFLGGKRTDPDGDPACKTIVKYGALVPTEYYIHKSKRTLAKSEGAKKLVIPRAAFSEIELVVKEAGSFIEWEFETKSRDIGFGLFLKEMEDDDDEKITELVPLLRLETEEFSEVGMYKCEKSGTYVMLFDNSYSWVRSKEIYYKAVVVTPKEHESKMNS